MLNKLQRVLIVTGVLSFSAIPAAWAEMGSTESLEPESERLSTTDNLRLGQPQELQTNIPTPMNRHNAPATTVEEWMAQIEASRVQITGVRLTPTPDGIEVVLETAEGEVVTPTTEVVGDALIAEIPNAVLALPDGEAFEQFNPAPGIGLVRVTSLPGERVQVSITGTEAPPTAQVRTEAGNLVLSVVPGMMLEEAEEVEEIELIVTATRTAEEEEDIPRSVTVIDREQIEEQSQLSTSLGDILGQTLPGFRPPTFSYNDTNPLRGRDAQVLIDGVPVTSNFGAGSNEFNSIAPAAVERIEVVRGPSAAFGEGATGGVINIITRRPSEDELTTTVEARVNSRGDLAAESFGNYLEYGFSGSSDPVDYVFNFSTEGFGAVFDGAGDRVPGSDEFINNARGINVLGKLGVDISENQRLQFSVNHQDQDGDDVEFINDFSVDDDPDAEKARAVPADFECIDIDCAFSQRTTTLSLNYNHDDIFGSQLRLQGFYRRYVASFGDEPFEDRFSGDFPGSTLGSFFLTDAETERWGGRLEIETPFSEAFNLLWGADYSNDENVQPYKILEEEFTASGDRVLRATGEVINFTPPYTVKNLGLFAQAQWDITPRWLLSGGVRYENISASVDDYTAILFQSDGPIDVEGGSINADDVVFNIGTVYDLTDELNVFASFAQGFGVPDFGGILGFPPDRFRSFENLDFTAPQKVNNYELGVRGQWQAVQFSLAGFFNESDLGTSLVTRDDGFTTLVRAPERIYGVEATVDWQPSNTWQIGGLISWSEGESDVGDDGDFEPLSTFSISPLKITVYVENETLPGWRNRLQALYVGGRDRAFEAGIDSGDIESYFVLDYISSIDLGPGSLQIGIQNLLDTEYFDFSSQPQTVAALSPRVLDPMLALGVQPAAYAESAEVLNLDKFDNPSEQIPHLGEFITTQPINLGDRATPSLEALVKVNPDLIVGETWHKNTQALSKIAPMLLLNHEIGKDGWSRRLQIIAQAFGREEQAEQVIAEYEQKLAEVKTKLAPVIEAYPLVLPIDPRDGGFHFESYFSDVADLLAEIGFQLVSLEDLSLEKSDDLHPLLSLEALVQLDPDIIIVLSGDPGKFYNPESVDKQQWEETPLLQTMRAVREGRTYFLNGDLWGSTRSGSIAYNLMLNQLPDLLLPLVEEQ